MASEIEKRFYERVKDNGIKIKVLRGCYEVDPRHIVEVQNIYNEVTKEVMKEYK